MKKVSLNELMGTKGEKARGRKLGLDDLGDLLGERMPKLEYSPVGKLRLTNALRNRFGDNYRQLHGIDDIIKEFDEHTQFNVRLQKMKMIKGK
jgi:hypothetical protein